MGKELKICESSRIDYLRRCMQDRPAASGVVSKAIVLAIIDT